MEKTLTRREQYLQAIASRRSELLPDTPLTREEILLEEIALKEEGAGGKDGLDGKSAYQQALDGGFTGTEEEFNAAFRDIDMTKAEMLTILEGGEQ